jgi:putative RNA 2'-phosphotransferase
LVHESTDGQTCVLTPGSRTDRYRLGPPELRHAIEGRHGTPVVLEIRAAAMDDRGYLFYETGNGVWLTDHVPPEFIHLPDAP